LSRWNRERIAKHIDEINRLPAAIAATGNDIKDVKAVIMGHLHLDHAGGLENFKGTDVPIYVHEIERMFSLPFSSMNYLPLSTPPSLHLFLSPSHTPSPPPLTPPT
jgi:glyoxylase-like metal-dependent hydrolase (beta-lactamase superfamily II)